MTAAEALRAYEAALATQDWARVEPLLHEDVCVTFSNGAHFRGKAEVGRAFSANFARIEAEQYELTDVHWISIDTSYAACAYEFRWSGIIDGEPASGAGRGTSLLKNQDGRWLVLAEHLGPRAP